jgi:hypothetical protein
MANKDKQRFFIPNINIWKYKNIKETTNNDTNTEDVEDKESEDSPIDNTTHKNTVKKNFEFFNWTLSFTKNVVQACFILFLIVNIFISVMITYIFFTTKQVVALEIYINEIFNMFITVIGGYIIKSTTENTVKIVFSVLSDWLEKKYGITNRLKEPEEVSDTYVFTGNNPTPNTGILADGNNNPNEFMDYTMDEDSDDEESGEVEYKAGEDESGE